LALLSTGHSWRFETPPLSLVPNALPVVLRLCIDILPLTLMGWGALWAFHRDQSLWVIMAVTTSLFAILMAPDLAHYSRDLLSGQQEHNAIVLGAYDCDTLTQTGVEQSLACVELAYEHKPKQVLRERYMLSDQQLPERPLRPGQCVTMTLWPRTQQLVTLTPSSGTTCNTLRNRVVSRR